MKLLYIGIRYFYFTKFYVDSSRFIVVRRIFLLMGLLYMMRSITMYVTVLPVASKTYFCSPKANNTSPLLVTKRVLQLISGFGLSINGKHTYCGDYIYSGHTVVLVLSYLIIKECKYFFHNIETCMFHSHSVNVNVWLNIKYLKKKIFQILQKDFNLFIGLRGLLFLLG